VNPLTGILTIDGDSHPEILPGDTIEIDMGVLSSVKALEFYNLAGTSTDRLTIRNKMDQQLIIDKSDWVLADGYGTGFKMERCSYFDVIGVGYGSKGIISIGPSGTTDQANHFHFQLLDRTHNFTLSNVITYYGGTPMQVKTFVTSDPVTWRETGTLLENIRIFNFRIRDCKNEGFYIGDTATYVNYTNGVVWQPTNVSDPIPSPSSNYKKPLRYNNVEVFNVSVQGAGNDALQFANIVGLYIHDCVVENWATNNAEGHKGAYLIGGGVTSSVLENCIAWNSPNGQGIWHFAEGPGHRVSNVLVYDVDGIHCFIKGGEHLVVDSDYHCTYENVTMCKQGTWASLVRNNGLMGGTAAQTFKNCLLVQPGDSGFGGYPANPYYFYMENGGTYQEGTGADTNKKFATIAAAVIDVYHYCVPDTGSTITDEGFRKNY
jgi:hypothetical protein